MMKVALFDVDGVVIAGRKHYFSYRLAEDLAIPRESIEGFFLNDFKECTLGKKDLKEEIIPYLARWGWQGTVDELLTYWFESESEKDKEVLKIVSGMRAGGVKCYVATKQEKYRMEYLLEEVRLKDYFDGSFCTCYIGYDKSRPEYFEYIFEDLNVKPEEVSFFDDSQENIDTATSLGVDAHFYTDINILNKVFQSL